MNTPSLYSVFVIIFLVLLNHKLNLSVLQKPI